MSKVWLLELQVEWFYFIPYEKPYELIDKTSTIWRVFASEPSQEDVGRALLEWVEDRQVAWSNPSDYTHIVKDLLDIGSAENFATASEYDCIVNCFCYEMELV